MGNNLKYEPIPENAELFAQDIVEIALELSNIKLDYSVESVESVEDIIEGFRQKGATSDDCAATLFGFGCYLGEVIIRAYEGKWISRNDAGDLQNMTSMPLLIKLKDGTIGNPIGKIFKEYDRCLELVKEYSEFKGSLQYFIHAAFKD